MIVGPGSCYTIPVTGEIVGGEEKIELDDQKGGFVHDDVIANVGTEELKGVSLSFLARHNFADQSFLIIIAIMQ